METYRSVKEALLEQATALDDLIVRAGAVPGVSGASLEAWQRTCRQTHRQMTDEHIRVAVVGPIKSGKSTFTNALLGADHLKRGAGIVTSIVTRIRRGESLEARLHFKSWEDINADLSRAIVMLPGLSPELSRTPFDLRREADRNALATAFAGLNQAALIADGTQDANSVMIASYLEGYDRISDQVGAESTVTRYRGDHFGRHRDFVGDDSLSVYLQDVELEIDAGRLTAGVEIADCQGSDSPNPHHLAMIQDYMLQTHLIIYVISSRTGLRQADFRFLSIIRKMGIGANMLFVFNCDFNEHASLEELQAQVARTREQLRVFHPDPAIFTLSALYHLLAGQPAEALAAKDAAMLDHWRQESTLTDFSDAENARFHEVFERKLVDERRVLLLGNHVERLAVVADGLGRWGRLHRETLDRDAHQVADHKELVARHRQRIDQIQALVRDTLDGAAAKQRDTLRHEIDRFFSPRTGTLIGDTLTFVRQYAPETGKYRETLQSAGFSSAFYLVFQDFRQALEGFLAETVTPEVLRFLREAETRAVEQLSEVARPFATMAREALADLDAGTAVEGVAGENAGQLTFIDVDALKQRAGLKVPSAATPLGFSARIRTEAVARLGFYTVVEWARRILKKPAAAPTDKGVQALLDGLRRIKRETLKAVAFHFKSYQENIKFQYLFKLVEAAAVGIREALGDQLRAYGEDLSQLAESIESQGVGRQQVADQLKGIETAAAAAGRALAEMRRRLGRGQADF
jgi:GTPase SAR1 family protein